MYLQGPENEIIGRLTVNTSSYMYIYFLKFTYRKMNYHRVVPLPTTPFWEHMLLLKIELKIQKLTVKTCIRTLPLCGLGFS